MKVRYFKEEDEQTFYDLCRMFYESEVTLRGYDQESAEKTFNRIMHNHENLWGLMLTDAATDQPIGYVLLTSYWCNEEGGNIIVIDELYISVTERHKGYGLKIMEWVEANFKNDAVAITLEVLTSNLSAKELYHKAGYQPDGFTTYTKKIN